MKNLQSLSARQAFICAALTGWKSDAPSSWYSPTDTDTIIAWAESYNPRASDDEMCHTFDDLVNEGLFHRVLYPAGVFRKPYYFCSFNSLFLTELPDNLLDIIDDFEGKTPTKEDLVTLWDDFWNSYIDNFSIIWLCLGLCHYGYSNLRPCLGPTCQDFLKGKSMCEWSLEFCDGQREGWPDMSFLDWDLKDESYLWKALEKADIAMNVFMKADNTLSLKSLDEYFN